MESGSPIDDQNLIDNVGSVEDFVSSLAQHGCSDLTQLVDQESCDELPATGGGLWDAYRGVINDGTQVIIKSSRLNGKLEKDNGKEEVLKRAARELYRWSRLKHPNINPLMGTAIFRGRMATVTQYTDNGSLMPYINANPNVDRIDLCIDICAGLKYLHENDMVHGDLKAAHVVVSHDGAAVITDLGSSQLKDLALKFTDMTNISFSLRWTAPELFDEVGGAHTSKKVDIYAYGMTILEVLTGKIPYEGLSEHQVLFKVTVKHEAPTRPTVGVNDEIWQLLQECWKWEQSERPDMLAVAERLLSSLASSVKEAIALVDSKPGQLRASGLDPLVPIFPSIASLQKTSVKSDTEQPEISLSKLARFGNPNQLAAAEFLKTKLLAAQRRLLGQDHPHTLQSMANLARAYCDQRRLVEAESLLVEALAKQKQILGNDHIDTQRSLGYLAMVYCDQKRAGEAEPLALEALAAQKKILGADHLDTLETMLTLSGVYDRQKRFGKAAKLMVKAIAAQKRILGANHPETVRNITGLAMTYDSSKRSADAESLLVDAVAIQKELLTIEHAHTLQTMVLLAKVYDDRNRLAEAERLLVEAVATRRRVLGDHHIDTLETMGCLALFYCRRGRSADSQSLLNELLAARKYFEGHAAMDDSALMEALTMTHLQQGQQGKAGSVMAELVAGQKESLGNDHPKTLTQRAILAGLYFNQGKIRQAESSFVEVIAAQKRVLGDEHPETLMSQAALSNVYLAQGRRYEAVALRFSTLASQRRVLGDAHPETIRSGVELEAMLPSGS